MEIDAYCFSTIADTIEETKDLADNYVTEAIGTEENAAFYALNNALVYFEEHEVPADKQIIFVSPRFMNLLRSNSLAISRLLQSDAAKDVKFSIQAYEGRDLVVVPPARFRTGIDLTTRGVHWSADSKHIDFMVVAKEAVMHVVKYNKVKIIGGDANLVGANFDGWSIFARVYHDVFIPDNKRYGIYVHVSGEEGLKGKAGAKLVVKVIDGLVTAINHYPAERKLSYGISDTALKVGDAVPGTVTKLKVGTTVTGTKYAYAYEGTKVVAVATISA